MISVQDNEKTYVQIILIFIGWLVIVKKLNSGGSRSEVKVMNEYDFYFYGRNDSETGLMKSE